MARLQGLLAGEFLGSALSSVDRVQFPIGQDLKSPRLETDYTVVLSLRIQF